MTVEKLHDALNLLPGDLITAVDRVRTAPKPVVIQWKRWVSLAACLVLVLSTALVFKTKILPGMGGAKMESAAEAPAAMAPAPMENGMAGDTVFTEVPAAEEIPAEDSVASNSAAQGADEKATAGETERICIEHVHRFAEEKVEDEAAVGYCGNMVTTIYLDGQEYSIGGSDSVTLTDILINLDYDSNAVCRCMAEFTVDTEMLSGIEVDLGQGFARCEKGQATLTEKQAQTIQEILNTLE